MHTIYFASLGCNKNQVDSEVMLGKLASGDISITQDPTKASIIVVNTCAFINDAKVESINTILELTEYKQDSVGICEVFVVAGCLSQRYVEELTDELPEVDIFIGTGEYHKIFDYIQEHAKTHKKVEAVSTPEYIHSEEEVRISTSPPYRQWLKVSEGCDRRCTYCIIPYLRGDLRSRTVESLVKEATTFAKSGVKELNVISQDLSSYGKDLGDNDNLLNLLKSLEDVEGIEWIRLFYYYPDDLSDEVIELMATSKKICSYLDIPVQHFSDSVLKRMGRKITGSEIRRRLSKLRERIPGIALRTSLIVGFPGETQDDFQTLLDGIEEIKFDHLGVFRYSDEEGTPAEQLTGKLDENVILERYNQAYELQQDISEELMANYSGKVIDVLVEGPHPDTELLIVGRHQGQAPDIDGKVIINDCESPLPKAGDIVKVQVTEEHEYDLVGRVVQ